jgi:transcription antitermination factor NusG
MISPVFPGYLFVQFDIADRAWGALLQPGIGIVGMLSTPDGVPLPLPLGFLDVFMQGASPEGIFPWWWPGEPPAEVRASNRIGRDHRIVSGPWTNFVGKCTAANRNRVALLMELFGRQTVVEFRPEQVEDAP